MSLPRQLRRFTCKINDIEHVLTVEPHDWRVSQGIFAFPLATDGHSNRRVFVKLISLESLRRFEAIEKLNIPRMPRILSVGVDSFGQAFVVQEYITGVPLQSFDTARLKQLFDTNRVRQLSQQVASAVLSSIRGLATAGLFYADLTARNILISESLEVWIIGCDSCTEMDRTLPRVGFETAFTCIAAQEILKQGLGILGQLGALWGVQYVATHSRAQASAISFICYVQLICSYVVKQQFVKAVDVLRQPPARNHKVFLKVFSIPEARSLNEITAGEKACTFDVKLLIDWQAKLSKSLDGSWEESECLKNKLLEACNPIYLTRSLQVIANEWEKLYYGIGEKLSAEELLGRWPKELDEVSPLEGRSELEELYRYRDEVRDAAILAGEVLTLSERYTNAGSWHLRCAIASRAAELRNVEFARRYEKWPEIGKALKGLIGLEAWHRECNRRIARVEKGICLLRSGRASDAVAYWEQGTPDVLDSEFLWCFSLQELSQLQRVPWADAWFLADLLEAWLSGDLCKVVKLGTLLPDAGKGLGMVQEARRVWKECVNRWGDEASKDCLPGSVRADGGVKVTESPEYRVIKARRSLGM